MKKAIYTLFILALALALALAGTATAEEIDIPGEEGYSLYVSGLAGYGDEALLMTSGPGRSIALFKDGEFSNVWSTEENLWNYDSLSEEKREEYADMFATLISGDDGMYAITLGRQLCKWDGSTLAPIGETLDAQAFEYELSGRPYTRSINTGCVTDGKLLAVFSGDESNDFNSIFYVFDIQTGEGTRLEVEGMDYIQSIAPYKDGKVLLCYQDPKHDYNMALSALDIASGKLDEEAVCAMEGYNAGGIVYDAKEDMLYYFDQGCVNKCRPGEQSEIIAYVPTSYMNGGAAILGGMYVAAYSQTLVRVAVDGSALPQATLAVQGGWSDDVQRGFLRENPGVGISSVDAWYGSSEEIANAIKTGEKSIDIFSVNSNFGLYAILNKGYALDLSDSQVICDAVASYYPNLAKALMDEQGNVCAVYEDLYASSGLPVIKEELWEEVGMGEYPKTYGDLIDLIALWEEEYAEEYPEYVFYSFTDKRELVNMVINAYIAQYENDPQGLNFSRPVLREVLEKIEALPVETIDWESMTEEDYEDLNERLNRDSLINLYGDVWSEGEKQYKNSGEDTYTQRLLDPLVFEEGDTPVLRMSGSVYIVNPESPNKDLAVKYLEYRVAHMEETTAYILNPALTEPVRMEDFEQTVKEMEKNLEELQKEMEEAEDVDKADYLASINFYTAWLEDKDRNQWRITSEAIARYREMGEYATTSSDSLFFNYDGENSGRNQISEEISRYADGQLTLDAFLREIDQKVKMIVLEGR